MKRLIADRGYDANRLRATLREQGTIPVIPGRRNCKRPIQYDERRYRDRWRVEAMFCRLKELAAPACGPAASPPDTTSPPRDYVSAAALAAAVAFWLRMSLDLNTSIPAIFSKAIPIARHIPLSATP